MTASTTASARGVEAVSGRRRAAPFSTLGVVAGAVPVDDDRRLIADNPGVVAARKRRDVARAGDEFRAVVHPYSEPAAHVILEVRRLAALGLCDRLDVVRPAPPWLKNEASDFAPANLD